MSTILLPATTGPPFCYSSSFNVTCASIRFAAGQCWIRLTFDWNEWSCKFGLEVPTGQIHALDVNICENMCVCVFILWIGVLMQRAMSSSDTDSSQAVESVPKAGDAMYLVREFQAQSTIFGKMSVVIYGFIIIFGGFTTILGMVAPILSADCMAAPFLSNNSEREADQLIWFKAMGRMCGALGTIFLLAVYMLGHSLKSLLLLLLWGWLNFMNFAFVIPADLRADGGSKETETCMRNVRVQVGGFAVLEAVAVLFAWLEERSKPGDSRMEPLNA